MAERARFFADGFTTLQLGMNGGLAPSRLPVSQCRFAINSTMRGDYFKTRPKLLKRGLIFADPVLQAEFESLNFQHLSTYKPDFSPPCLILVASGRFFRISLADSNTVTEITIPGDPNSSLLTRGWSVQAELFWIYQDGQSPPFIFDGASARRALLYEIKVGTVMAYAQGRVWYSLPGLTHFRAGDLVGSDSGTPFYDFRDSVLKETENTFLNEGGDFSTPEDSGGIQAMRQFANLDTSLGQGPLQVFCLNKVFSVNAPVDRTLWKDVTYPLQTVSQLASGATSQQSTVNVNGDIFYRSLDGLRSFKVARRDFEQWGNTPISFEMSEVLDVDQQDLLNHGSAVVFDNRHLQTVSPSWSNRGVYHRGLQALDLSRISLLTLGKEQPSYDGLWTGLRVFATVTNDLGCFLATLSTTTDKIELWELTSLEGGDNNEVRIQSVLETRALFASDVWSLKELKTADLYPENLAGTVNWTVRFKPDSFPCWLLWHTWEDCAPLCTLTPGCTPPAIFRRQYRPKVRLPDPPEGCLPAIKLRQERFFELQVRIEIEGQARLRAFRAKAAPEDEAIYEPRCDDEGESECVSLQCCGLNPFSYSAEGSSYYY